MLPDYEMITHTIDTEDDITIYPVFDVHFGSEECMEEKFLSFLKWIETAPNAYIVLGGDLINNNIRSAVGTPWRETRSPSAQKREMAELLKPVKRKILCSVTGNHERRSTKDADDDPSYDIMAKLDMENLHRENIVFMKIQLGRQENATGSRTNSIYRPTYILVVTHGAGGGIYTGTSVLRAERFGYAVTGMDALIVGHSHRPFTTQPGQIVIDPRNNTVSVKPFKVISATSWMEYGGYAAQKMLLPTSHALNSLTLSGRKKEMVVTM